MLAALVLTLLAGSMPDEPVAYQELAKRCGTEFPWVANYEEAAVQARKERKLLLVYARLYAGFAITDDVLAGPFMDPDIVDLLRERFVVLRLERGMDTPLRLPENYGLSPSTFGTSFLVCSPPGQVLGESVVVESSALYLFLLEQLRNNPEATGCESAGEPDPVDEAWRFLRRGDLSAARQVLQTLPPNDALRCRADLLRRERKGEEALAMLQRLRESPPAAPDDLELEEGLLHMGLGRLSKALSLIARFADAHPQHSRFPEALFWRGELERRLADVQTALETWEKLFKEYPDNRWAWWAAGLRSSAGFGPRALASLAWPTAVKLEASRLVPFEPRPYSRLAEAEEDALRHLLDHQRADGSWIGPSEVGSVIEPALNALTVAASAIAARSLLAYADDPEVAERIERAQGFLDQGREKGVLLEDLAFYMDYTVYSNATMIRLLAATLDAGLVDEDEALGAMEELVGRLQKKQRRNGGWSYYVTGNLATGERIEQSISFVTALIVLALLEAEEVGAVVPEDMLERALSCLEQMRNPDRTFEYMLLEGKEDAPRHTGFAGAAGRGPLCELALLRGDRSKPAELAKFLDIYFEHQEELCREAGKGLMHCGLQGQGSHYVLFDLENTAHAIAELPRARRSAYRRPLLEALLRLRTPDGGYQDNPLIGRAYGAGMALSAIEALRR